MSTAKISSHLALSKVAAFDFPIAPKPTPTAKPSVNRKTRLDATQSVTQTAPAEQNHKGSRDSSVVTAPDS